MHGKCQGQGWGQQQVKSQLLHLGQGGSTDFPLQPSSLLISFARWGRGQVTECLGVEQDRRTGIPQGQRKVEGAIDNAWPTEALSLFERAGKEPTENDGSHPLVVTGPGLVGTPPKVIKSWQMTTWTSASCRR